MEVPPTMPPTPPPTAGVLAGMADVRAAPADRGGALWRLTAAGRQLDANIVRVPPGGQVDAHVEPDLDVLLCVLTGSGELATGDTVRQPLEPGGVAWLPHGTRRAVSAGPGGLVYVTAHQRRPGLFVRSGPAAEGGEPACLLSRICPACDRPSEDIGARYCARCGTELPS
ncbi:cupin domain-containing protein [Streptomyces sp. NPDC055078]